MSGRCQCRLGSGRRQSDQPESQCLTQEAAQSNSLAARAWVNEKTHCQPRPDGHGAAPPGPARAGGPPLNSLNLLVLQVLRHGNLHVTVMSHWDASRRHRRRRRAWLPGWHCSAVTVTGSAASRAELQSESESLGPA